ncbi:threonine ammonia-lyase, biosynthetic [Moraxella caviae]|uniref:L-threonine dehydratase n=2 Tax=Moraxella caviae TaxID=34060 RepID=A0A1T0ABP2_9GAMM|nr:threonine ammonia-lyase, biosynthetic [Moraxella caviae]OOR93059.1 threonine ammonia-lyase, biosynthetic [Moraxella caviae]STZ10033.1 L-threonine dehydratase biosynthetic IlvA [Moraxella caviae]VEW13224.1 L-threonine dehydratase biosynthetic IlvA [Moraxella caviae]
MLTPYVRSILQATVYDVAITTPLTAAPKLSARFDNQIRIKREDLQPVFSFKLRGAYNKISQLSAEQKSRGIICASAGNHAQGVAFSANKLGLKNVIVMPTTTPDIKVQAVRALGGNVELFGDSFDKANRHAIKKAETEGLTYIAPYDDELVIAGQGTIALEIMQQWRDVDYVFAAVGGGGLIAGIAAFLGEVAPHVKVIAVEPEGAACLKVTLETNERKTLPQVSLFADGTAVAQIGALPFEIAKMMKSDGSGTVIEPDVVTCTNDEICAGIKDIFEETRSIVEPSGALALAGMKKFIKTHGIHGKNCVAILSGANMNFDRLRYVAERTEIGEQKEAIFAVQIPEKIGAFLDFCRSLQGRNITEFNYRAANTDTPASIFVGIALKDGQTERHIIKDKLAQDGYTAFDLTDDEFAKTHIRYMVGGHAGISDEQIFRVMFPERPGALLNFLEKLGQDFNITLFHYRNHGAAEGRILVGIQASKTSTRTVLEALSDIGYECEPMTDNVGYQLFLK